MTIPEMDKQFDILYDNISSNQSAGINKFEKSVLFTKAQDDLVREIYSPFNRHQQSFESSENRRTELKELIKSYSSATVVAGDGISSDSKFFAIPDDVYYIIQEEVQLSSNDTCTNAYTAKVVPITHDEYNIQKDSPFRKPNKRRAWRMDISEINGNNTVEIITPFNIASYKMRYIKKPRAIIFSDFESDPELEGMGLTVGGLNTITECELREEFHNNIVDRAVELAIRGYRENTLQANVELNNRNV